MSLDLFVQYFLMFAIVFDASIAWFVLLKNPKRAVNQAYFFMLTWITLWQIFNYILNYLVTALNPIEYIMSARFVFVVAAFLPVSAIYFVSIYPNKKHNKKLRLSLLILGLIFAIGSGLDWLISLSIEDAVAGLTYYQNFGWFYPYYAAYILSSLFAVLIIVLVRLLKAKDRKIRIQFEYLLLGLIVPILLGTYTNMISPLISYMTESKFLYQGLYNAGPASTVFLSALTAYAILRHRLMDIKAVIRRNAIVALIYIITLAAFFVAGYALVKNENSALGLSELGSLTLILAIVLVLAWPLYVGVKRLTRRLIKPQIIDIHKWSDLEQQQLAKVETTEQVARLVAAHFQRVIPVTHYTCVAYNHDQFYEVVYSDLPARKFDVNEPWVQALQEHQHTIISTTISAEISTSDTRISAVDIYQLSGSTAQRASLQRLADRYQAQFILPLATDDFFIGALLIGDKINAQPFSTEELRNMEAMRGLATQTLLNVLRLRKLVKTDVADYEARLERRADEKAI